MNKIIQSLVLLTIIFFASSCNKSANQSEKVKHNKLLTQTLPKYAKGFRINYHNDYRILEVINPWDTSQIMYRYQLVSKGVKDFPRIPESVLIETPISSMACLFTTQLGFAVQLGVVDYITGMSRADYVKDSVIRSKIDEGKVTLFGEPENPNAEMLIAIDPDILMVSPFRENKYQHIESAGIPLAVNGSYMEGTPLGRAEWIKFMAYFFEMESKADSIFNKIENQYNDLKDKVSQTKTRPTIFTGRKFNQVWHVAGANSYMGQYVKDAGFDYIWKDLKVNGSLPYEFETVYKKCAHADYWSFIEYQEKGISYKEIEKSFQQYADFDAFKNRQVISCNSHKTTYFEEGILEPHIVLADFIKVAHPEIVPNHNPKYFKAIK